MAIRILHIMGGMHRGGVETCLMHFLRKIDRQRFQIDILVHTTEKCEYDQEIQGIGIPIIPCPYHRNPLRYAWHFSRILKEFGPYDIIHSHVHQYSGFILRLARLAGIRRLIVHSHSNTLALDRQAQGWRKYYLAWMDNWIRRYASAGLACSREAAQALYGSHWEQDPRWRILYCAIDLEPFKTIPVDRSIREKLQIPPEAMVIGHVGRFTEAKNHEFLLRIFVEVLGQYPETYLLLIGDGILMENIQAEARHLGIADKIVFVGSVSNVPYLLRNAMDVFVFPSLYEGLPLALLEAQAAGLPCIASEAITEEGIIVEPLVQRLPLSAPVAVWAKAAMKYRGNPGQAISPSQALSLMESSPFNINVSVKSLKNLYENVYHKLY
jgi:glycosyltransferase involved in cell wall biosynthesis